MANTFQPGGGNSLPNNASGFLENDGSGNLSWAQPAGGGSPTPFVDIVSAKTGAIRNGGYADSIYDSYYTAYSSQMAWQQALLLENISAGATLIRMAANAISPADTYSDATTGWSIFNQAVSLAINTATKKVGPTGSIMFSKASGGTITMLSRTPTAKSLQNNLKHVFWMNFPQTVSGASQIFFRLGSDSSNYMEWQFNTSGTPTESGTSIQVGWNLFLQDCSTGGTVVGTGWTNSQTPAYYSIGFYGQNTSSFSGILIDGLFFGDSSTSGIQLGNELSIYNTSTKDNVILDAVNSTKTTGTLFLSSGISNSYTADNTTFLQRSTVGATGAFIATIPGASVMAGSVAEHRQTLKLQDSAAASNVEGFIDYYQNYFYPIVSVASGASANIVINAGSDIHTFYGTSAVIDIFQPLGDSNGNPFYKQRTGATYIVNGSATNSSGFITVPMNGVSSIIAGDYAIKRCVDLQLSTTASGANESFSSMPVQRVEVINPALYIPDFTHLYGYWDLSGSGGNTNKIPNSSGSNMTITGSVTQINNNYYNGKTSSGTFSTSNFINLPNAQPLSGNSTDTPNGMAVSIWFKAPQSSASRTLIAFNGNTLNGHYLTTNTSNQIILGHSSTADITASSGAWQANVWTHVYYYINASTPTESMYVNGVFIGSASTGYSSPGALSGEIGLSGTGSNAMTDGYIADIIIWRSGAILSQAQINSLYNNGIPPIYYGANIFRNRYLSSNVTASQLEAKAILTQSTTSESTSLRQWAVGRRS